MGTSVRAYWEKLALVALGFGAGACGSGDATTALYVSEPSDAGSGSAPSPTSDGATALAEASVTDGDAGPLPALSVADSSVHEGNSGMTQLAFVVTLSAASSSPVTVDYATADGTAVSAGAGMGTGRDYAATSGTLTFAAGQTEKTITVDVIGDRTAEPNETFSVNLTNPGGATIGDSQAVGTIENDD